jgi:hypothetical protein
MGFAPDFLQHGSRHRPPRGPRQPRQGQHRGRHHRAVPQVHLRRGQIRVSPDERGATSQTR